MKILANDGIAPGGKKQLEAAGFEVITTQGGPGTANQLP